MESKIHMISYSNLLSQHSFSADLTNHLKILSVENLRVSKLEKYFSCLFIWQATLLPSSQEPIIEIYSVPVVFRNINSISLKTHNNSKIYIKLSLFEVAYIPHMFLQKSLLTLHLQHAMIFPPTSSSSSSSLIWPL